MLLNFNLHLQQKLKCNGHINRGYGTVAHKHCSAGVKKLKVVHSNETGNAVLISERVAIEYSNCTEKISKSPEWKIKIVPSEMPLILFRCISVGMQSLRLLLREILIGPYSAFGIVFL